MSNILFEEFQTYVYEGKPYKVICKIIQTNKSTILSFDGVDEKIPKHIGDFILMIIAENINRLWRESELESG